MLLHSRLQQDSTLEVRQVYGEMKGKSYLRYRQAGLQELASEERKTTLIEVRSSFMC